MKDILLLFSRILDYPTETLEEDVEHCLQQLQICATPCIQSMQKFASNIQQFPLSHLQELYTQHIDFNPSCSLYVGYHLFGDSYKRSKLLVRLRTLYKEVGFVEKGAELPDSLLVILNYFGDHSYDSEDSRLIIKETILPSLEKLQKTYKKSGNIYHHIIQSLLDLFLKIDQNYTISKTKEEAVDV